MALHSAENSLKLLSGKRHQALLYSILLAALGYLGFTLWSGWHNVTTAIGKVGLTGIICVLSLSLLNYSLRFIRWQTYLRTLDHRIPWRSSFKIYLAGFALTTTPGKTGELLRSILLQPWKVPYPQSLALFLSERLSDLLAIIALTLSGLATYPAMQPLITISAFCVISAFLILLNQTLQERLYKTIRGTSRFFSLLRQLLQILQHARQCHTPILLIQATLLSLIAWAAEAWALYLILKWMGLQLPFSVAAFIYAASLLAGALSFIPGGLGSTEAAMITLLVWKGADMTEAAAAAILIRLTTLWFSVGIGILTLTKISSQKTKNASNCPTCHEK